MSRLRAGWEQNRYKTVIKVERGGSCVGLGVDIHFSHQHTLITTLNERQ